MISAYVAAGALVSGAIIGYLADRWHPYTLIIPGFLASVLLLIVQGATDNIYIFGTARALMYFFAGGLIPVSQKILSIATPLRKRGAVFGWSST